MSVPRCLRTLYSLCIALTVICLGYIITSKTTVQPRSIAPKGEDNCPLPAENQQMRDSEQSFHRDRISNLGYVMATRYSDQMTGSMANLACLQCWAGSLGPAVRVVEPFLCHSHFGMNLYATYNRTIRREVPPYDDNSVALSDIVDMLEWDNFAKEKGWSPQIKWKTFIKAAPRQIVLVYRVTSSARFGDPANFYVSSTQFLKHYGFGIVRNISLPQRTYREEEFKKLVYGDFNPREVVVVFSLWGGIQANTDPYHIGMYGNTAKKCGRGHFFKVSNFPPSNKIARDASKYTNKYLDEVNGYISVMVRIEHLILRHGLLHKTKEQILSVTTKCFHNLLKELTALKDKHSTEKIFLTLDCRESGSQGFKYTERSLYREIATTAVDTLFPMLYGNSTTLDEWDKSFEDVVTHNAPGYIAMLQKHLAAKGVCLLTVGGGVFQQETRQLHSSYHPNGPKCARLVSEC